MQEKNEIAIFEDKKIRRIWHEEDWWFSVVDVVWALTESPHSRKYWEKIKNREQIISELSPNWGQLKMPASDGKYYKTDCANLEGLFRIIQSSSNTTHLSNRTLPTFWLSRKADILPKCYKKIICFIP